jgi:hypothetical protein
MRRGSGGLKDNMTAQDIVDAVRQIVQETDPNNTHRTDSTILADINACTLQLCAQINTLPKVSVTGVVAADTITMPTNLLRLDFASISDEASTPAYTPLDTMDFVNFVRLYPNWQNQPDNKPAILVRKTDLTWQMYPYPDSTWASKALTLIGSVLPTPLTAFTQSPDISITLHPAYEHYCAWKFFLALNNPERAGQEYVVFDGIRKLNQGTATSTTGSQLSFKLRGA